MNHKRGRAIVLLYWVLWSATVVTKNDQGGWTYRGGLHSGPAADSLPSKQPQAGQTLWHKSGLFFDTLKECEAAAKKYTEQWLVCLPNGEKPRSP